MNSDSVQLLDDLTDYLKYLREEGRSTVEVSPQALEILKTIASEEGGSQPPDNVHSSLVIQEQMELIAKEMMTCMKCELHAKCTNIVPGQGSMTPDIAFVGEAPGYEEDQQGIAFVGRAGQLLTKMIEAMGYTRDEVWIGNILKCRPPNNRTPLPDEMEACMPYLKRQLALLKPKVIVALGGTAAKGLLGITTGITKIRGNWFAFEGIDLMPTFHPAYLLRNPAGKREVWEDLKEVLRHLGRPIPNIKKKRSP